MLFFACLFVSPNAGKNGPENSEYGHFSRSAKHKEKLFFSIKFIVKEVVLFLVHSNSVQGCKFHCAV